MAEMGQRQPVKEAHYKGQVLNSKASRRQYEFVLECGHRARRKLDKNQAVPEYLTCKECPKK